MPKRIQRAYLSLADWRDGHHLSQRDAAAKFGISQSGWNKIELGTRHPRRVLLKKLVEETGVPLEVLVGVAS